MKHFALLGCVWALWAGTAQATTPIPPIHIYGPSPRGETALVELREAVYVDCAPVSRRVGRCEVQVIVWAWNPTDQPIGETFEWPRAQGPAKPTVEGLDEAGWVEVPPRGRAEITVRYVFDLHARGGPTPLIEPALTARHRLIGEVPHAAEEFVPIVYQPNEWEGRDGGIEVRPAAPYSMVDAGWRTVGVRARSRATHAAAQHEIYIRQPPRAFFNGGPFVALGGTFGENGGVRARAGYEVGVESAFLMSLAVESDLSEELTFAPLVQAATPRLAVVPSLGAGLGPVVRVRPERRVGLRLQLDAIFVLGLVTTFDYFPSDAQWRVSMLGQVGL